MQSRKFSPAPSQAIAYTPTASVTGGALHGGYSLDAFGAAANSIFGQLAQVVRFGTRQPLTVGEREELVRLRRFNQRRGISDDLEGDESAWVPTRPMLTDS